MRTFSFRPTLTLRGRTFKGPRGWSGKPTHPPLTDIPVAAYLLTAAFDLIATAGHRHGWARDFFHAATWVVVAGFAVSLLAVLTGWWDRRQSSEKGTQARRTINAHALVFDYGFSVETAGDDPVWHPSERDVLPGRHGVEDES